MSALYFQIFPSLIVNFITAEREVRGKKEVEVVVKERGARFFMNISQFNTI